MTLMDLETSRLTLRERRLTMKLLVHSLLKLPQVHLLAKVKLPQQRKANPILRPLQDNHHQRRRKIPKKRKSSTSLSLSNINSLRLTLNSTPVRLLRTSICSNYL
jgi:hypothetical protein